MQGREMFQAIDEGLQMHRSMFADPKRKDNEGEGGENLSRVALFLSVFCIM
jgi:hypothetical protein